MKSNTSARTYELTYLLPVSLTDAELSKLKDQVLALVKKHKGEVIKTDDWGKRRMAYKIKHSGAPQAEAVYTHLVLSVDPESINALDKALYLQTSIMRHLLVVGDDRGQVEEKVAA